MGKISQCMIVRNEEKNIERALSWGKGIVSEQIVVDTGSTDRTVELAKKMGAKLYYMEWNDDFAAAKNYAIDQASGDWILFLDADEYFTESDVKKIPKLIRLMEKQTFLKDGHRVHCNAATCLLHNLNANGEIANTIQQIRIFKNSADIRYEGRIHEQIAAKKGEIIQADVTDELAIYHTGYAYEKDEVTKKKKGERNTRMLREEIAKNPDSATLQLYLAEALPLNGNLEEALQYAMQACKNTDGSLTKQFLMRAYRDVLYTYHRVYHKQAEKEPIICRYYKEATALSDSFPDYDVAMGYWMYDLDRYEESIFYFRQALEKLEHAQSLEDSMIFVHLCKIYEILTISYQKQGDLNQCFYYAVLSLQLDAYQDNLTAPLLYYLDTKEHAAPEQMITFLQQIYHLDKQKDVIYLIKMAVRVRNVELVELLKGYLTEENKNQLFQN